MAGAECWWEVFIAPHLANRPPRVKSMGYACACMIHEYWLSVTTSPQRHNDALMAILKALGALPH